MNKPVKSFCCGLCVIAMLALNGGHWLVLQSIAWGRMIARYSEADSVQQALSKTFDGKHACPMCLKIQKARQKEAEQERKTPWVRGEKSPELFFEQHSAMTLVAPDWFTRQIGFVPQLISDFIEPPPVPPPRFSTALP